ncbi:MAG TPA: methyltransferase domain-containing protein [Candidatus Polarisedimenticolaceae bacterium]|nr:methyltransferase domain-containing protein [Candidatus Polarisedimenticolaceae bacterium]
MSFERAYFETYYADYAKQNPPRKLAFYRSWAESLVGAAERPRVLDVGCAFGSFLGALDPRWELHGIDVSEYAIGLARERVPRARLAVAGAGAIPFPAPFDLITAFDVIEHVPDLPAVREGIRARLGPRGHLLFVVPVYDGITGPVIRRLDRDPTHVHRRSRRFWLEWAGAAFDLVRWAGIYRYLLPGGYYWHRPTRRLRGATPAIIVAARARA